MDELLNYAQHISAALDASIAEFPAEAVLLQLIPRLLLFILLLLLLFLLLLLLLFLLDSSITEFSVEPADTRRPPNYHGAT